MTHGSAKEISKSFLLLPLLLGFLFGLEGIRAEETQTSASDSASMSATAVSSLTQATGATPVLAASSAATAPRRLSISTSFSLGTNLREFTDSEHQASLDMEVDPTYKINDSIALLM